MYKSLSAVLISMLVLFIALPGSATSEEEELEALLALLAEETTLATKTKLNADYVPGMVTVLHGEELEALGIRTVVEALGLVPGINPIRDRRGSPSLQVRGIAFPFNSSNVKVLLNSVEMTWEASGTNASLLMLPVSQVERIEVIRGPGSSLYGDFAFAGLVNIITREEEPRIVLGFSDDDIGSGALSGSWQDPDSGFRLGYSVAGWNGGEGDAPIDVVHEESRSAMVLSMGIGDFELVAQRIDRDHQQVERDGVGDVPFIEESTSVLFAKYSSALRTDLDLEIHARWWSGDGAYERGGFEGEIFELGADFLWQPGDRHQVLIAASHAWTEIVDARFLLGPPPGGGPPPRLDLAGVDRANSSLTIQDQISVSADLDLILGLRWDDFEAIDEHLTPRLGLVWRVSSEHILKAQVAESFRSPAFFELYSLDGTANPNLGLEEVISYELGWIWRRSTSLLRATAFHTEIDEMIFPAPGGGFANHVAAQSEGFELELERSIGADLKLRAQLSWVDTLDDRRDPGDESLGAADLLADLVAIWRPARGYVLSARWHLVDDRFIEGGAADGYQVVDLGASLIEPVGDGWTLRFGVANLFDEEVDHVVDVGGPRPPHLLRYTPRRYWFSIALKLR